MSTLNVDLANLKPGVKYSFTSNRFPGAILEGTFERFYVIPGTNNMYKFFNVAGYVPDPNNPNNMRKEIKGINGKVIFANQDNYPENIFLYTSNQLPGDLNKYINSFGGYSRKSKRTRKSKRRHKKSMRGQTKRR
jgi:hypothetical protein